MAKTPSNQTISSYQSSLQGNLSQNSGLDKATSEAIISKTYNDKRVQQLQKQISLEEKSLKTLKEELAATAKIADNQDKINKLHKDIAEKKKSINNLNKEGVKYIQDSVDKIMEITSSYKKQLEYQEASLDKKLEMKRQEEQEYKARLDTLNVLRQEGKLTASMLKERQQMEDKYQETQRRRESLEKSISAEEEKRMTYSQKQAAQQERINKAREALKQAQIERDAILNDATSTDTEKGLAINKYNKQYQQVKGSVGQSKYEQAALAFFNKTGSKADKIIEGVNNLNKGLQAARNYIGKYIDDAMSIYTNYMGKVDARLYGTNLTFTKMQNTIASTLGSSMYVSQTKMLDNLYKLTESGIAFNLEYRSWLETVSDKMVTTFDTLDQNLTRLVRLQQADVSNANLGSEALMTKFLNSQFKDTSYLNNMYDSVRGYLMESLSTQNATNSIGYEFSVQKWLGALSSVGLSDSAVSSIAQALNWLGSGNVSKLNSDNASSTLLNLAAQRAGLDYSQMLLSGTNADNINKLMKGMVTYLQDVASSSGGNQVVKSEWGNILNLTMSDMRAIQNLTSKDISSIYNTKATYSSSIKELNNQVGYLSSRTSTAEMVENVIRNTMFEIGSGVAQDPTRYVAWKAGNLVSDLGDNLGGVLGGVTSLIGGLSQLGAVVLPLYNTAKNLADNGIMQTGSATTGNGFNFQLYQSRGKLFQGVGAIEGGKSAKSSSSGTSYSMVASTASDVGGTASVNLAGNANKVQSNASTVTSKQSTGRDAEAIYAELFEKQSKSIKVNVVKLSSSIIDDLKTAMNADSVAKIENVLTNSTIRTTIDNADVFANTANTIRYVQGL